MILDALAWFGGGVTVGVVSVWPALWRRRPLVVRSDILGRWVAARSRIRFEVEGPR